MSKIKTPCNLVILIVIRNDVYKSKTCGVLLDEEWLPSFLEGDFVLQKDSHLF